MVINAAKMSMWVGIALTHTAKSVSEDYHDVETIDSKHKHNSYLLDLCKYGTCGSCIKGRGYEHCSTRK